MQNVMKTFVASASELQSSDLYMTIKATQFTVPSANLNGVRCTIGFMDEIVEHQDKYIGLPLCADTVNLVKGRYQKLGHCYDPKTGIFSSSIIGSFYRFEKEELDNGEMALVGYARVMKRNKRVCKAIGELFAEGALKFSFEISCGSYEVLDDDTILIDAADNNFIEGMCIVSFPACPEAVALDLVAEINSIGKEADNMTDVIETVEIAEEEQVEEAVDASEAVNGDDNIELATSTETAEVIVTTEHFEREETRAFDTQTGTEVTEVLTREQRVREVVPEATIAVGSEDAVANAEEAQVVPEQAQVASEAIHDATEVHQEPAEPVQEVAEVAEPVQEPIEAVVEQTAAAAPENVYAQAFAELQEIVAALRTEIESLRQSATVIAEKNDDNAMVNPFISEISTPVKYSLLDKVEKSSTAYSLLDRA